MKKKLFALLLILVLSLGLCAAASAQEAPAGVLAGRNELSWRIDGGVLSLSAGQPWEGGVFAACYNGQGRLETVKVLTPDQPSTPVGPWVTRVKLFWAGADLAPQCESVQARLAPDRVVTQGVYWLDLTRPGKADYLAPAFSDDCTYTLNGETVGVGPNAPFSIQDAAAKRGAVTEFEVEDGAITSVTCYDYTVRKVGGQVLLCCTAPDGTEITEPVTRKVTGTVTAFNSTGELLVNETHYKATGLTVQGCDFPISEDAFSRWGWLGQSNMLNTFDFYLDKSGSICWIDQLTHEFPTQTCVVLAPKVYGGSGLSKTLRVRLLFTTGETRVVTVSQLEGKAVTDPAAAAARLSTPAFYTSQETLDGTYTLTQIAGRRYDLLSNTSISPAADFTGGVIPLNADSETVFLVASSKPGTTTTYHKYWGFQELPKMTCTGGTVLEHKDFPGTAHYVYLEAGGIRPVVPADLSEGYVFICSNAWEENPDIEDTYLVNIVDTQGSYSTIAVNRELREAISADSTKALEWAGNTYVGKFLRPTVDENGVVTTLEPAEKAPADILALANQYVQAAGDNLYDYDNITKFVYVDLAVDDRDLLDKAEDDALVFSGCGEFDPERFYDAEEIDATHVPGVHPIKDATAPFASIQMTMISKDGYTADYVYVVRIFW